jgi:hypothetical protein
VSARKATTPLDVHVQARRVGPTKLQIIIAGQRVVMEAWAARSLAGSLLRGAARIDPDFRSKP